MNSLKLNYRRTFFIGLAFMSISAFWQMYDNIIPLILQNSFHLGETVTGMIMAADNILAVFLLPLFGTLSDKTDTPFGKRTPFIIAGTILAIIFMMLLPAAEQNGHFSLFIIGLGLTLISMGLYRSPSVALMPDLTPKPLRSKANAVINLMGAVGGIYSLALISLLLGGGEHPHYFSVFLGVAILMAASILLLVITIREKKLARQIKEEYVDTREDKQTAAAKESAKLPKDVMKSLVLILISIFLWFTAYNAVTTAFSRYAQKIWGIEGGGFANCLMVATVAAIISYIPIGLISSRIGRKKSILIGLALMLFSYLAAAFFHTYHPIINVGFALIGIGWAAVSVNSLPMVVEMCSSSDVGKYTGFYYTFSMAAQIFTPVFSGFLLEHISYHTLFPYAVFFTLLAICTMSLVKHGDSKPERKESVLENFDVED